MARYTAKVTQVGPESERIDFEAEGHGGRRESILRNAGDTENFPFEHEASYEFEDGEPKKVKGKKKAE